MPAISKQKRKTSYNKQPDETDNLVKFTQTAEDRHSAGW